MDVRIVEFVPTRVAVLEHRGAPALISESVSRFIAWRKSSGLSPVDSSHTFGIAYDNPETTDAAQFRFDICGAILDEVPQNAHGVTAKTIPGGRCAVLLHLGSHDRIGETARYLYRDWLPASGETLRDFPLFFHYLNLSSATPAHALVTDIYLPLR